MIIYPALSDALWAEFRPDHSQHFASILVAPNGSLVCCTDYDLVGVLAKEILAVSS